ncbi:double-stranded RNA-binding protein Staufen homolog isoform X2 [Pomacea canaliculata]|nr:double-stranded RNA-binding protein Staufen homolog isoform X2 [Pomacea canaliculata]
MSQIVNQPGQNQGTSFQGILTTSTGGPPPLRFPGKTAVLATKVSQYSQLSAMQQSQHLTPHSNPSMAASTLIGSGGVIYGSSMSTEKAGTASVHSTQQAAGEMQNGTTAGGVTTGKAGGAGVAPSKGQNQAAPVCQPLGKVGEGADKNVANTKEKTPMCLINELARYNKVAHQYTLVDEQGPAHKKIFYVKLKLGEEEYSAFGESIKKAQHAAAANALETTKFPHPVPKAPRYQIDANDSSNITPTVELNALAMKRGEPAVYKLIETRSQQQMYPQQNMDYRGLYNQRYHYGRPPRPFYVLLKVGLREFIGDGPTRQAARHSAASKALSVLKNLPMPRENKVKIEAEECADGEDAMKSEISLVHEIALKRNLAVNFEVIRESGPPHMKTFVTVCQVGEFVTEAEGNSKKVSKKRAAELMLDDLRKLPPLPSSTLKPKLKQPNNKKKNRNIIKVQKADPSYGVGINPISRLIQIMQAQKKKEPIYTLLAEKGLPRKREFVVQVQVEEHVTTGAGPNKKLAKRNAAESMLQLLGFSRPSPQPIKSAIKSSQSTEPGSSDKKVTFVDGSKPYGNGVETTGTSICQMAPGLLRINQITGLVSASSPALSFPGQAESKTSVLPGSGPRAEQQLNEIASRLGISIKFDEFSKINNSEHLTCVTLSTAPPQMHHGTGPTVEASRDAAALAAIHTLLNASVTLNSEALQGSGDVPGIKTEPASISTSLPHRLTSAGDKL